MIGRTLTRMVMVLLGAVLISGCSNTKNERITILEQNNANLTEQLNRSHAELDGAFRDRDELNRRLAAAYGDVDALRMELAAVPEPTAVAPGWTPVPGGAMIAIAGEILFPAGKVALRTDSRRTLDGIVSAVQGEYGNKHIFVFGHTDDQPIKKSGWKDNWELSSERALSVVRYLKEHGVTPDRLVGCGAGEFRPRSSNNSASDRGRNRRVEIFAIDSSMLAGA